MSGYYERLRPEYYDFDPQEYLKQDLDFYLLLAKQASGRILELGYGTGRVTFEVAKTGKEIHGIDISKSMTKLFRDKLGSLPAEARERIHVYNMDMSAFDLGLKFGLIIIPYRTFACLLSVEEMNSCLVCIKKHLAPNGVCALSLSYANKPLTERWIQADKVFNWETSLGDGSILRRYSQRYAINKEKSIMHLKLIYTKFLNEAPQETVVEDIKISYLTYDGFRTMAENCGFSIVEEFGDFKRGPIDGKNKDMIFILKADK